MTTLCLYDDARARRFEPFALTRPGGELRAGAELVRRRWERALGARAVGAVTSDHLAEFEELDAPPVVTDRIAAGTILASTRFAPALIDGASRADTWRAGDRVAAVRLGQDLPVSDLDEGRVSLDSLAGSHSTEITGWWIDELWDLIRHLTAILVSDIAALGTQGDRTGPDGVLKLGTHDLVIEPGATVEPYVVFDATAGPILLRKGSQVAAFTRIVGPFVLGEGSTIAGGRVAACSIGDHCKVHGELSSCVFLGHANKSHDGFVGHSYLGRWVNLGASTVTSNLKNTYGSVALWTPEGIRETGMQFLGTLFGDHTKTAIGTRLTTGSVIGAGANVFGGGMTPKVIPPFSWGIDGNGEPYSLDKFLVVAERMMARRSVALGSKARSQLGAAHARRWGLGT